MQKIIRANSRVEQYFEEDIFITELLNTESFNPFSVSRAVVKPGITTVLHMLVNTDEVYCVLTGKGEMEINGEVVGVVEEHDIVFIPRNQSQRIKNIADADLTFLCICTPRFQLSNYRQM